MEEKLKFFIIILLISLSKQDEFKLCYNKDHASFRECTRIEFTEDPQKLCCYQTIDYRKDDGDFCGKKCIVSMANKTIIRNYIQKMKKANYNIEKISIQCSGNYLSLLFSLLFLMFLFSIFLILFNYFFNIILI